MTAITPDPRLLAPHDRRIEDCGFDAFERIALTISRRFFSAFARPEEHGWIQAFDAAERLLPPPFGATVAAALMRALDIMRQRRRSAFDFVDVDCRLCSGVVTQEERHLISTLAAARRGRRSEALVHATMLCEGESPQDLVDAFERMAVLLGEGPLA